MCFGALMNITMIYSMTLKQLDPLNHTDIYCLHFVFLLRIQKHLRAFQESWNHHALSTENTNLKSPYQTLFLLDPSNCAPPQTSLPTTPTVLLHTSLYVTQHVAVPRASLYHADHWYPLIHSTSILLRNKMTSAVGSI